MQDLTKAERLPDGIDVFKSKVDIGAMMQMIEDCALWTSPETFQFLPVWYPDMARDQPIYKAGWNEPQLVKGKPKSEGNLRAMDALTRCLGLSQQSRRNWTCCHIWGVDSDNYNMPNRVVRDPRFFSCPANMILLPDPMKFFTDKIPEVRTMLRICSRVLYGWTCDHEDMAHIEEELQGWSDWSV